MNLFFFFLQVIADVHHGELFLRADLSGSSLSERSLYRTSRQTEAQTGAQLRTGETSHLNPPLFKVFCVFLNESESGDNLYYFWQQIPQKV